MEIINSMSSFLPGLYLAALVLEIVLLIRAVKRSNRKLWATDFRFTAFMCLFSYVLVLLSGSAKVESTDANLAALSGFATFFYSFAAGIIFLVMWIVILVVGLKKFKKKEE